MYFGHVLPAVPAGQGMGTELRRAREAVDDLVAPGADALVGRQPQTVRHCLIHADDPVLPVEEGDQVRYRVKSPFPLFLGPKNGLLGRFPFLFGPIALRDVAKDEDHAGDVSLVVLDGGRAVVDRYLPAASGDQQGMVCQAHDGAFAQSPRHWVLGGLTGVPIDDVEDIGQLPAQDLFELPAHQPFGDGIHERDEAVPYPWR